MELKIRNFAKIKNADIVIDGLTVITGNNDSGKSTVGKVLYSTFNSLYDLEDKIEKRREDEIFNLCYKYFRKLELPDTTVSFNRVKAYVEKLYGSKQLKMKEAITKAFVKDILTYDGIPDMNKYEQIFVEKCEKCGLELNGDIREEWKNATYDYVITRLKNDTKKISLELISRYFNHIFDSQIQCLKTTDVAAEIELMLNHKKGCLKFENNVCSDWNLEYNVLHEAFLIDDPFVLDEVADYFYMPGMDLPGPRGDLVQRLRNRFHELENDLMEGLFDAVSAKDALKEIYEILDSVADGDIVYQNNHWGLRTKQYGEKINFENLSAGLKSFVLIKVLLEKGILKEKDVLILDEPEIHLHPEWQLLYAEIIVLLQKKFELSIVVTTHSSHFLESLEYYSKKHAITDKCKYYMANVEDGLATFEDVTISLDKVYKKMVTPSMLLDRLKYEMDSEDE